ncbi:MAG TPA: phage head morphogenesis protein, partial [Candidatus Hydrogenedentes bacterium]|nr:phage head morphogenesis protein [Candidatus Hydrogenedentota bacterium]
WGSKQDFITLLSETDPAKIQAVHEKLAAGYQAHQAKYGKKKPHPAVAPSSPKTPSTPPAWEPAPSPVPAPAVFAKKGSEFVPIDASWEATRGKPSNFTYEKSAKDAGGVHAKEFWLDTEGNRWMFKPADNPLLAHSEEMAYRLGRLVDPDAIEVRVIALNGRVGTIQKMKTGLRRDYDFRELTDFGTLTREEIEQLQREHVVDWFVSNHDNHPQQFIRTVDGRLYGVDKGQAGKFLGRADEELRLGYNPNSNHGSLESLYDRLFRAAKAGQVQMDPSVALRYIREIEQIPDDVYLDAVRAYADARFGRNEAAKKSFLDMLLARKQRLRKDFERYYGEVLGRKDFRFEADIPVSRK